MVLDFFQIGGGIAGDFPIVCCADVAPGFRARWCSVLELLSVKLVIALLRMVHTQGAVPNEKITWGKLSIETPKFIVESDATIVAPLMFAYILDM
jgi:deoxyhypusine synthase